MKKYFITGGAGFIGSNFIHYLIEKYGENCFIVNLDALTYAGNLHNLKDIDSSKNYVFVKGDICDSEVINELFLQYEFDYVINFAAESHVDRSIDNPSVFISTNVMGTRCLLDMCVKYWDADNSSKKYIQVSTDEVYGSLEEEGFFTEETKLDPHSPYAASKAGADLLVSAYNMTYGLNVNITRCSNNYGEYQFPEKLIPLIINNALNGKELPVYGDGLNIRDWLYVKDHCSALDIIINEGKSGEIYNIGGNNEKTNIELVYQILDKLGCILGNDKTFGQKKPFGRHLIKYVKDRKGHDRRYAIDSAKLQKKLGWKPETSFNEGIDKTVKWYVNNKEWLNLTTSGEYEEYYNKFYGGLKR